MTYGFGVRAFRTVDSSIRWPKSIMWQIILASVRYAKVQKDSVAKTDVR